MRMDLQQAGWHVVWANDIHNDKMKMYQGHFTDDEAHFHLGDVQPTGLRDHPNSCSGNSVASMQRPFRWQAPDEA